MGVITSSMLLFSLALPQEGPPSPPSTQPPSPVPQGGSDFRSKPEGVQPRIRVDERGWPLPGESKRLQNKQGQNGQPLPQPQQGQPAAAPLAQTALPQSNLSKAKEGQAQAPDAKDSPLLKIFRHLGGVEDMRDLEGVVAQINLSLLDHRGGELGAMSIVHEADMQLPDRDRLHFAGAAVTDGKIYGRDGQAVYAEMHGIAFQSLEQEARQELEIMGLLLRFPWAFADATRFVVYPAQDISLAGRGYKRVRVERLPAAGREQLGPQPNQSQVDRFDLICTPERMQPAQLHITLAATGITQVVELRDYRSFGSVRLPTRRIFIGPTGHQQMEMVISRLDVGVRLPKAQFQPQQQ